MFKRSSSIRGLAVAAAVLSSVALAQVPANDTCAGAEVLTLGAGPVTSSTASSIDLTAAGVEAPFACFSSSVKNSVWYAFTPATTGFYRVETCGPVTNYDTVMQMYSGSCAALTSLGGTGVGCNDQGGCIIADASALSLSLTGGTTYYVQVAVYTSVTLTSALQTALTVSPITAPANDSCAGSVPPLLLNTPLAFSTNVATTDDSQVGGDLTGGAGTCFSGVGQSTTASTNAAPGRDVVFNFTPGATGRYNVRLSAPSASVNTVVYVTDSCTAATVPPQVYAPPQCIAAANRNGTTSSGGEELVCVPLTNGVPYFVWADEGVQSSAGADYELEVTACFPEIEANDTPATASPLACPLTGSIGTNGDIDFFTLGTFGANARAFATIEGQSSGTGTGVATDFDLRVTTATDTLETDTSDSADPFGASAGSVAGTPLPSSVPAYLRINYSSATVSREPYRLHAVVQTATPVPEAEPNDTLAQANAGQPNYFSGDIPDATDVDLYAFEARAGALVFLSLDSKPDRLAGSTGNHTLGLLNASGASLVAVNDANTTVNTTVTTGSLTATTPTSPSEALVYRIRSNGTYFARVGRTSTSTTVTGQYLLSIATDCTPGGGIGAPSLTGITPSTGTVSGGTAVTLSGGNFSSLATVTIGGNPATITNRTAASITVTTPAGNEGAVDVVVSNPGAQSATLTGAFTYFAPVAPPTIATVTPASGPTAGGTVITVTGTLFKLGAEVTLTVGGAPVAATNVIVDTAAQLRATTPAHAPGLASITVRNPVDMLEGSRPDVFTYLAPPAVTSITPASGLTSGGQTITLTGSAFRTGAVVRFGAIAGTGVVVDPSGTSLTVLTPAAALAGPVNVTVVNTDTQQTVVTNGFTYLYPAPTLATVTPARGFATGGTALTLAGTGFQTGATVTVGGAPALNVVRVSLTQITAVTPPGTPGVADVTVTNTDAQAATRTGAFTYVAAPTLSAISPANGPVQGGTLITLTGTDFQAGATVRLGGVPAFAVTVTSPTTATAVTNGRAAGTVDVVLTNPDTQSITLPAAFTFDPAPTLTAIAPTSGSTAGGTVITLTGSGFLTGAAVLFGSSAATNVTLVSPTELTAQSPARAVGVVSVTVRNPDNQEAELARAYRYVAPPTLTAVAPATGDVAGGTVVTLTGSGFGASSTVAFGGTASAEVTLVSGTELQAVSPAHGPGAVDVVVSTDGAGATLSGAFTYTRGAPTLTAIAPPSGPIAGGSVVTITGTGFAPGATVSLGGTLATDVVVVSPVLARAVIPAHAEGVVDVLFTNDDTQSATLARGFTYVAPPSNTAGTVTDGGTGSLGEVAAGGGGGEGGVSCGCSAFDPSTFGLAGFGLLLVLSRRRRR